MTIAPLAGIGYGSFTPTRKFACSPTLAEQYSARFQEFQADSDTWSTRPIDADGSEPETRSSTGFKRLKISTGNEATPQPRAASFKRVKISNGNAASKQLAKEELSAGRKRSEPESRITITYEDFERRAEKDTATVEDAGECLRGYKSDIEQRPLAERKQACNTLQIGRRILVWLLGRRDERPAKIYRDREFTYNLMWFVVAEDLEDAIFDWLRIAAKNDTRTHGLENHLLGRLGG